MTDSDTTMTPKKFHSDS